MRAETDVPRSGSRVTANSPRLQASVDDFDHAAIRSSRSDISAPRRFAITKPEDSISFGGLVVVVMMYSNRGSSHSFSISAISRNNRR